MRGTLLRLLRGLLRDGIIPAHAGNTRPPACSGTSGKDHPRACGEHYKNVLPNLSQEGIIPAHAGNTKTVARRTEGQWDHPRACGEHAPDSFKSMADTGSSPRMRGTQSHQKLHGRQDGIIPAHAGNTDVKSKNTNDLRDHPRACGEHVAGVRRTPHMPGSSPRMRGTRAGGPSPSPPSGIIPAHAGNTRSRPVRRT